MRRKSILYYRRLVSLLLVVSISLFLAEPSRCVEGSTSLTKDAHSLSYLPSSSDEVSAPIAIVIGAGPIGIMTALSLSKVCQKVLLVEKQSSFENRGAFSALDSEGQACLNELDAEVYNRIKTISVSQGNSYRGLQGRMDSNSQSALVSSSLPWLFLTWEFRNILVDRARKERNIQFCMGRDYVESKVLPKRLAAPGARVVARFRNGLPCYGDFVSETCQMKSSKRPTIQAWTSPSAASCTTARHALFRGNCRVPSDASSAISHLLLKQDKDFALHRLEFPTNGNNSEQLSLLVVLFRKRNPKRIAWFLDTICNTTPGGGDQELTIATLIRHFEARISLSSSMKKGGEEAIKNSDSAMDGQNTILDMVLELSRLSDKSSMRPFRSFHTETVKESCEGKFSTTDGARRDLMTRLGEIDGIRLEEMDKLSLGVEDALAIGCILLETQDSSVNSNDSSRNSQRSLPELLHQFEEERLPRLGRRIQAVISPQWWEKWIPGVSDESNEDSPKRTDK